MRYAIFSDIHANLQAWEAIREDMVELEADVLVCLGDVVGYGPLPEEVLTAIRKVTRNFVLGNHDAAAVGIMNPSLFNANAEKIIKWTRKQLSSGSKKFLSNTPLMIGGDDILFVHAEITEPGRFGYIENADHARQNFEHASQFVTFIGHTHHPTIFDLDPSGEVSALSDHECVLDETHRYIINVGSAGEPRNPHDIRACYVIYDSDTRSVWFRRVEFDAEAYRRDLAASKLKATPFFLEVVDEQAALEAEAQHAMMPDMRVPEDTHGFVSQADDQETTQQLILPQSAPTDTKPKPTPGQEHRTAASMISIFALVSLLLVIGIVLLLPPLSNSEPRVSSVAPADPSPAPTIASPQAIIPTAPAAVSPLPAADAPARSIGDQSGPAPALATAKVPSDSATLPEAPVPPAAIPAPVPPKSADIKPAPTTIAHWRMDEVPTGDLLPDAAGLHPLRLRAATKTIDHLAPDPIPQTGDHNPGALVLGVWEEVGASGAFEMSAERSMTFEGWLMTFREQKPIFVAGTQDETGSFGWRLDVAAAKSEDTRGSIRFLHDAGVEPTLLQSSAIELYGPTPHHFAVVWDHDAVGQGIGTLRIFYDGVSVAMTDIPHTRLAAVGLHPFRLGAETNPQRVGIDEIRITDGTLAPSEFFGLDEIPNAASVAFMVDAGAAGTHYNGADSPAHSEGAIPKDQVTWISANDSSANRGRPQLVKTADGRFYPRPLTIEFGREALGQGRLGEVQWSKETVLGLTGEGTGLFASELMDGVHPPGGKRAMGLRVSGLEAGVYALFFTPVAASGVDTDFEFALGVDPASDSTVVDQIESKGMRQWTYRAGMAKIDDQRWVSGQNYFKHEVNVEGPDDHVVALVAMGDAPSAIPYLQIVKIDGPSSLPQSPAIEFRFDDGSMGNQASGRDPNIAEVSEIGPKGFVEGSFALSAREDGGQMLTARVSNPAASARDYFSFTFKVVGAGASLTGLSLEVSGEEKIFYDVSLHNSFGGVIERIAESAKAPSRISWHGFGTLAAKKSIGLRLAPDIYEIRISGFDTDGAKALNIDNIRIAFEDL